MIRSARLDDAPAIAEIYVQSWRSAFAGIIPQPYLDGMDIAAETAGWLETLRTAPWPKAGALVAEEVTGLTGFAGFSTSSDSPTTAELDTLYILPGTWGAGVGRRLMAATVATLQEAGYAAAKLWVLEANSRARRFYEAQGWLPDGEVVLDTTGGVALLKMRYQRGLLTAMPDQ